MSCIRATVPALALILVMAVGADLAEGQVAVPADDYVKLLDYAVNGIKEALKEPDDELNVRKAQTAAVMIAAYSQANLSGADAAQRATVRDAALKLADTIRKGKYADAVKQADGLAKLKPDANAKKEKVKLLDVHVRLPDLMHQFDFPPKGGWGIERELYAHRLGMKSKVPIRDLTDKLMLMGYQVAVTADLVNGKVPAKNEKEWALYTGDLRAGGAELAESVKKKDGDGAMAAIAKITTSCATCHKIFRPKR